MNSSTAILGVAASWLFALTTLLGGSVAPTEASEQPDAEVVQGRYLRIESTLDREAAARMDPGDEVQWHLAISADAPDPGTIALELTAAGDLPVVLDLYSCAGSRDDSTCSGPEREILDDWRPLDDGRAITLGTVPSDQLTRVRIVVRLDGEAGSTAKADLQMKAVGAGESIEVTPDPLPPTGGVGASPLALTLGACLLIGGAVTTGLASSWSRRGRESSRT